MEINEIKAQLNIVTLFTSYGLKPNRNNMVKCPFHEDNKASLVLYPKTNTWHCFGCDKGTDVIDFIQLKENCTVHQAIKGAKVLLKDMQPQVKAVTAPTEPKREITDKERIDTLTKAFTYFVRTTKAEAKTYLSDRQLNIEKLTVGYDSHTFHKAKEVTAELKELYLETGLIYPDKLGRANNFHSFFDNCVVFPTFNQKGEIVNLYGRSIIDNSNNKHRYLKGKHQGIYPHYPKSETERLIITEKIIDTATLLSLVGNILEPYSLLSLYGTNNFTDEMQTAIKDLKKLKEIILFFDGDHAGRGANELHGLTLQKMLPKVKISYVETPENEDINSLAQSYGENTAEYITELLNNRKAFGTAQQETFILEERKQEAPQEQAKQNPVKRKTSVQENSQLTASVGYSLNTDNPERLVFKNNWLTASVWGGIDFQNLKKLRATLHLQSLSNEYLEYRDTIDLYSNANTQRLIREANEKLETGTIAMSKTVSELTKALEHYRNKEREKERTRQDEAKKQNLETFTAEELAEGKRLLLCSDLMEQTEQYFQTIGLVGEEEKGMLLFFILLTRMFKNPLHALVQGKSGSGKTYLLKRIASLIPKAHCKITTALTENTLYHSAQGYWQHKILLIEDLDGALSALLPLREMMSNQSISKFSTEKNLKTGEFEPKLLYVEGPVCVAGATTKDKIYEDNANRSFLIHVNETAEHQEKALELQRRELSGLLDTTDREQAERLFKTAQLNLVPMEVKIPFGEELRIPDYVFKKLRTNAHYLTLIKAIAFWHQGQRPVLTKKDGTKYVEATLKDVEIANRLSKEVLLRKSDELDGALRGFFESIKKWLKTNNTESFYAKQIREKFRMNPMQVNRYLRDLDQRGYVKQSGGNRKTGYEFSINIWDDYEVLKSGIDILDSTLEVLKKKYNTSITEV